MASNRDLDARADSVAVKRAALRDDDTFSDDLPRFCLELDPAESKRKLAWINAICFVYVVIGCIGLRAPALDVVRRPAQQEEAVPVVIEPLTTAAQQIDADSGPRMNDQSDEPAAVSVVADSALVAFSVPTVGNLVVPMNKAQAPPKNPMAPVAALTGPHIERIDITGTGGTRPKPSYPRESLMHKEQGSVVLLFEVDESGKVSNVTVKQSSGFFNLDKAAMDTVKRQWFFSPAAVKQQYEWTCTFQLE